MTRRKISSWKRAGLLALGMLLAGAPARADDPLDEYDPTSGWDQVAPPPHRKPPPRRPPAPENDFRKQIEDWESVRQAWSDAREVYVREKQKHNEELQRWRAARRQAAGGAVAGQLDDGQDWGDDALQQPMIPAPAIDRAIDSELQESGATPAPVAGGAVIPSPAAEPAPAAPTPAPATQAPSPFRQADDAPAKPAPAPKAAAAPAAPPAPAKPAVAAPEPRKENEEAQAGAAAAEAFLKELQEQQKKEQEALRKKARLKVDEEGQVVDPELQREMEQGPDPEQDSPPED